MSIKFIDGSISKLNNVIEFVDWSTSAIETYKSYTKFKSNVRIMEDGIILLETFTQSDDVYVKKQHYSYWTMLIQNMKRHIMNGFKL